MHLPCEKQSCQGDKAVNGKTGALMFLSGKAIKDPIRGYEEAPQCADVLRYSRRDFATEFGLDGHLKRGTSKVVTSTEGGRCEFYSRDRRSYRGNCRA